MSDIKLIKPKKTLTARQRRKKKHDRIGAGLIAGSALGMGAAIIKGTKDKIDKAYGKNKVDKKKIGGSMLIDPKFKKTPKNRKKDQFKDSGTSPASLLAFPATAPMMYGMGKLRDYKDKKKKESKKASPEIKAEGAKKGKMIKLRGGGAAIRGTNFKGVF